MSSDNLITNDETTCCGIHVITLTKFVALFGILNAFFSIISAIFLWYYVPFAFVTFLIYVYVLIGIQLERPSLLLPAVIILSINFILNFFTFLTLLIIGIIAPLSIAHIDRAEAGVGDIHAARDVIRASYLITAAIVLLSTIYNVFALAVIQKARHLLITLSQMPSSFSSTEFPATHLSSPFPPAQIPPTFAPKPTQTQPPPPPPYSETL